VVFMVRPWRSAREQLQGVKVTHHETIPFSLEKPIYRIKRNEGRKGNGFNRTNQNSRQDS
jgi:hypothetical protein